MRYMNDYDIDRALRLYDDHPILGPAARTLSNLAEWTNNSSDGWAYWRVPVRAAAKLMELIERDGTSRYDERPDVTIAEYRAALRPIKSFRTKHATPDAFTIEEVRDDAV